MPFTTSTRAPGVTGDRARGENVVDDGIRRRDDLDAGHLRRLHQDVGAHLPRTDQADPDRRALALAAVQRFGQRAVGVSNICHSFRTYLHHRGASRSPRAAVSSVTSTWTGTALRDARNAATFRCPPDATTIRGTRRTCSRPTAIIRVFNG